MFAEHQNIHTVLLARVSGCDESKKTPSFEVGPNWRIVLQCEKTGAQPDVKVFVETPTESIVVLTASETCKLETSYRDAGRYRVRVIGFDASWTVVVLQDK